MTESKSMLKSSTGDKEEEEFVENAVDENYDRKNNDGEYLDNNWKRDKGDDGLCGLEINGEISVGHNSNSKEEEGMIYNVVYQSYHHGKKGEAVNVDVVKGNKSNEDMDKESEYNVLYETYEQDKDRQPEESDLKQTNLENGHGTNTIYKNYQRNNQQTSEYENMMIYGEKPSTIQKLLIF